MTRVSTFFGTKETGVGRQKIGLNSANHPAQVIYLNQTHSADIVVVTDINRIPSFNGDAIVTNLLQVGLAVKTADCAPLLLFDETAGVIAAVHSGWLGTLHDIITPTIMAMRNLGAEPERIQALIGPCLQRDQFEVSDDLHERFIARDSGYKTFFAAIAKPEKYLFDHLGMIKHQLSQADVCNILPDPACTLLQSDRYYSYRARHTDTAHDTMRNVSLIWQD